MRVISRNNGFKVSIQALVLAIPGIVNIILVSILFYYVFALIGVNYFKGLYY
jgi:Ion transport protein